VFILEMISSTAFPFAELGCDICDICEPIVTPEPIGVKSLQVFDLLGRTL